MAHSNVRRLRSAPRFSFYRAACWLAAFLAWLAPLESVRAHVGAPYPVLLEEPVGPYVVSALADPDVGGGTFYVLAEIEGERVPAGTSVALWAQPQDGHVGEFRATGQREDTRYGERFLVEVPFDAEGTWQMRLVVDGPAGSGETAFPVEVTPSGTGWLATIACLIPFALAAALWLRGTLRTRAA